MNGIVLFCEFCQENVEASSAIREVGSWLILDCPRCRFQSDVTFKLGARAS